MKRLACLCFGLLLLLPSQIYLSNLRKVAPPVERLGYIPSFEAIYFFSLEYRLLMSELMFYDAIFYYGALMDRPEVRPDYRRIYSHIDTATRLNPYNIDAYYFAQAVMSWETGNVKELNELLKRGVSARKWDFYLHFFLGFNYSYFLKDYDTAAKYMTKATQINPQFGWSLPTLTGRLYYQANKTDEAIRYLQTIYEGTRNTIVRKNLLTRITAFESISLLEKAVVQYEKKNGYPVQYLSQLVKSNILKAIPPDPYGGTFFYDQRDGRIKTTSNFTPSGATNERNRDIRNK